MSLKYQNIRTKSCLTYRRHGGWHRNDAPALINNVTRTLSWFEYNHNHRISGHRQEYYIRGAYYSVLYYKLTIILNRVKSWLRRHCESKIRSYTIY